MSTPKRFAAALRASVEDEDAARARGNPGREKKRRTSVKTAGKTVRRFSVPPRTRTAKPAKPISVELAMSESLALKQMRDALRAGGRAVRKNDLMRAAVTLLEAAGPETIAEHLDALPRLIERK